MSGGAILTDEYFMQLALKEAERAYEEEEVPIGAVVVCEGLVIGKGYNQTLRLNDPTAHAEMLALTAACEYLGTRILEDCTLYVTIEPCAMCAGALAWARPDAVVYGAGEPKFGYRRFSPGILHPRTQVHYGVLADECREIMQRFFAQKRNG